mmetsp:Transcript_23520/g.42422  ORF Transcript_23520/g.42422 Transcript_23520/m.42422 type:complete len:160 (+) Transcript_23520:1047-1526(+)
MGFSHPPRPQLGALPAVSAHFSLKMPKPEPIQQKTCHVHLFGCPLPEKWAWLASGCGLLLVLFGRLWSTSAKSGTWGASLQQSEQSGGHLPGPNRMGLDGPLVPTTKILAARADPDRGQTEAQPPGCRCPLSLMLLAQNGSWPQTLPTGYTNPSVAASW